MGGWAHEGSGGSGDSLKGTGWNVARTCRLTTGVLLLSPSLYRCFHLPPAAAGPAPRGGSAVGAVQLDDRAPALVPRGESATAALRCATAALWWWCFCTCCCCPLSRSVGRPGLLPTSWLAARRCPLLQLRVVRVHTGDAQECARIRREVLARPDSFDVCVTTCGRAGEGRQGERGRGE